MSDKTLEDQVIYPNKCFRRKYCGLISIKGPYLPISALAERVDAAILDRRADYGQLCALLNELRALDPESATSAAAIDHAKMNRGIG